MSFINSMLKVFVGDKSQKDVKALQGNITKIKAIESTLGALSHDELSVSKKIRKLESPHLQKTANFQLQKHTSHLKEILQFGPIHGALQEKKSLGI